MNDWRLTIHVFSQSSNKRGYIPEDKENWRKGNRFDISTKCEEKKENGEVVTDSEAKLLPGFLQCGIPMS